MSGSNTSYMVGNATTKLLFEVFLLALQLQSLRIWFIFIFDLSSWLSSQYCFGLILKYTYCVLSSTTFTYSYVFMFAFSWSKWMWSDPNPFCASTSNSTYPNRMLYIETYQLSSLNPCQKKAMLKEICPRGNNKVLYISLYHDKCLLFMLELY